MSNKERILTSEIFGPRNYVLTFRTMDGDLLAWCIRTGAPAEEVPNIIAAAAKAWLLSPAGRKFILEEDRSEWGFDNANALQEIPAKIWSKHNIFRWTPIDEVIELDPDENLLPDELRK